MSKNASFSMIGADVVITGDISASADLHIDGRVHGDITCLALVQGAASEMIGTITAQSAHLAGTVRGSIVADALVIQRSAHIVGDVQYESLTIEQGAQVEGTFARRGTAAPGATPVVTPDAPVETERFESAPLLLEGE